MSSYIIWIPGYIPPSLNELKGHWSVSHRKKKADRELIATYAKRCGTPPATGRRRVELRILLAKGERRRDEDNLQKVIFDSMKQAGLIVNDSPEWCEHGYIEQINKCPIAGTYIHLTDL